MDATAAQEDQAVGAAKDGVGCYTEGTVRNFEEMTVVSVLENISENGSTERSLRGVPPALISAVDDYLPIRELLRRQMTVQNASMRMLAELLQVDPAVLSNFLAGGTLDAGTALRMLPALFHRMSVEERRILIRAGRAEDLIIRFLADDAAQGPSAAGAVDWRRFRELVQEALREQGLSLRELARRSGLTAGALSRFLRIETMSLEPLSVLKIYLALRDGGLSLDQCRGLLASSGLDNLVKQLRLIALDEVTAAARRSRAEIRPVRSHGQVHADQVLGADQPAATSARQLYDRAITVYHTDWPQTIALLDQAAQAAADQPQLRALSLMTMIMPLSSLGRFRQASEVVQRIERHEAAALSDTMRTEFFYHRSFLLMQHRDPLVALQALETALEESRDGAERSQLIERSAHHFGMLYHRLARREISPIRARSLLQQALQALQLENRPAVSSGDDLRIGFNLLRSSQVHRTLGDDHLAARLRRRAAVLFRGTHAEAHIAVEEANLALRFGTLDYRRAGIRFRRAHELWLEIGYQAGLSRVLSGIGLVAIGDREFKLALSAQLSALLMYPEGADAPTIMHRVTDAFDALRREDGWRWTSGFLQEQFQQARAAEGLFRGLSWDERHDELQQQLMVQLGHPQRVLSESTRRS